MAVIAEGFFFFPLRRRLAPPPASPHFDQMAYSAATHQPQHMACQRTHLCYEDGFGGVRAAFLALQRVVSQRPGSDRILALPLPLPLPAV